MSVARQQNETKPKKPKKRQTGEKAAAPVPIDAADGATKPKKPKADKSADKGEAAAAAKMKKIVKKKAAAAAAQATVGQNPVATTVNSDSNGGKSSANVWDPAASRANAAGDKAAATPSSGAAAVLVRTRPPSKRSVKLPSRFVENGDFIMSPLIGGGGGSAAKNQANDDEDDDVLDTIEGPPTVPVDEFNDEADLVAIKKSATAPKPTPKRKEGGGGSAKKQKAALKMTEAEKNSFKNMTSAEIRRKLLGKCMLIN